MSEIKKIGMYTIDEILEFMTDGEGRGFMGRSMYDAIYFKIEELENQLQQKENIIREVREYIMSELITDWDIKNDGHVSGSDLPVYAITPILEILDKAGDK